MLCPLSYESLGEVQRGCPGPRGATNGAGVEPAYLPGPSAFLPGIAAHRVGGRERAPRWIVEWTLHRVSHTSGQGPPRADDSLVFSRPPSPPGSPGGLATATGFEPATSAVTGRRSNHLSYVAILTRGFLVP